MTQTLTRAERNDRAKTHDRPLIQNIPWTVIEPGAGSLFEALREVFEYRDLFRTLVWRDLTTRYRQTLLGVGWALMQPFSMMIVLSIFVGRFMHAPTQGCPYPVFAFASLLCFQYFSSAVSRSAVSLMGSGGNLLKKLYFPRILLPFAAITVPLVDFSIGFAFLLLMLGLFHVPITPRIFFAPLFIAMAYFATASIGLWLSALYVRYRDIHHLIPFLLQATLFATPIAYASSIVPTGLRPLYELNMLVAIVDGFRWSVLGIGDLSTRAIALSLCMSAIVGCTGLCYFRSSEGRFADHL